ncbi:pentatricopeptide repeat-containing protein At4g39530-like [Prosopis cineraria]|uniref:pentatricopeptide repeat-containing protein At4g39530-like n=1 Tax=Prosopis cineraria TaxID=364024 RepID=UPI00240FEE0D|nr:pentatricopeptide repeat-containing protein At4g39530-like [Prosopis cineraria]
MPNPNVISHNTLLSSYFSSGFLPEALETFFAIPMKDSHLWNILISGHQVHAEIAKVCSILDSYLGTNLLQMFASYRVIEDVKKVFGEMPSRDLSGHMDKAMWLFYEMQLADVKPNSFTFGGMLGLCASRNTLQRGKQLHGVTIKYDFKTIWYAQNGEAMKALKLYNKMVQLGPFVVSLNDVTFIDVLNIEHYTCMVDMLARSGLLKKAEALLLQMPFKADAVMWSTLLGACKLHGNPTMVKCISGNLYKEGEPLALPSSARLLSVISSLRSDFLAKLGHPIVDLGPFAVGSLGVSQSWGF